MKTIKIFLASSDELDSDRKSFGNFCRKVNDILIKYDCGLKVLMWEDFDAEYNLVRKQDEYNEKIKEAELFFVMFKTIGGKYTFEEYDVAVKSHERENVFVYQRNLKDDEKMEDSLVEFHKRIEKQIVVRHYSFMDKIFVDVAMKLKMILSQIDINIYEKGNLLVWDNIKIADKMKLE